VEVTAVVFQALDGWVATQIVAGMVGDVQGR
jgi:hypothetical protein